VANGTGAAAVVGGVFGAWGGWAGWGF
jgi:hypothetical protein